MQKWPKKEWKKSKRKDRNEKQVEVLMKKISVYFLGILFIMSFPCFAFSQTQGVSFSDGLRIKPGIHFEYFNRKMTWDEKKYSSELKSYLFALNAEFQIEDGFSLHTIVGYSLSSFDTLVFRQLPFSVELEVGNIDGYVFGAELRKSLIYSGNFEVGAYGQFIYYLGKEKEWDLPGLNVPGTVTGKPTWMRASLGPIITYTGFDNITPYLCLCYNNLWGKFKMTQNVQNLQGTEEKDLRSKSLIDVSLGSFFDLTDRFFLKSEVHISPHGDGMDLGFVLVAAFSF